MTILQHQVATLKSDIVAKSQAGQPLELLVAGGDWQNVAAYYNTDSATKLWRPDAPRSKVFGAIIWKNLTQADAPDGTTVYTNRALACQSRQINLQIMLPPTADTLPGDELGFRQGLQDALVDVPAGVGGALLDAGWTPVRNALQRFATHFEALFIAPEGVANKSTAYGQRVDGNDCYQVYVS